MSVIDRLNILERSNNNSAVLIIILQAILLTCFLPKETYTAVFLSNYFGYSLLAYVLLFIGFYAHYVHKLYKITLSVWFSLNILNW